jgi:hypothetical protein
MTQAPDPSKDKIMELKTPLTRNQFTSKKGSMSFMINQITPGTKHEGTISSNNEDPMYPVTVTQSIYKGAEEIPQDEVIVEELPTQEDATPIK